MEPKILFSLKETPYRHGELRHNFGNVSERMIAGTLRSLEPTGLIIAPLVRDWQAEGALSA